MNEEEHVDIGEDVVDAHGEKLGTVQFVVVRPPELNVTDVVVSTGAILGRDVVVPIDAIERIEGERVVLTLDKDGLNDLPDYVQVNFEAAPEGWMPPVGMTYPAAGVLWPADMYYPRPESVDVNAPAGTVALAEGMAVDSSDGHHVGSITAIDTDEKGDVITGIVVKQGFLLTHDVTIPVDVVAAVEGDRVRLALTRDQIQQRFAADR